jgi:hypothetical protein
VLLDLSVDLKQLVIKVFLPAPPMLHYLVLDKVDLFKKMFNMQPMVV